MTYHYHLEQFYQRTAAQPELSQELALRLRPKTVAKGTLLLRPGEIAKHLYFIKTGFFRRYQLINDEEHTLGFAGPDELLCATPNFVAQRSDGSGIICEDAGHLLALSYHDLYALEELSFEFLRLFKDITVSHLLEVEEQATVFRLYHTLDRYLYLCNRYKGFANKVSQRKIASFLGVAPSTLSQVLKDGIRKTYQNAPHYVKENRTLNFGNTDYNGR